jgi:uncharacterized protein YndB with AHSA1/START domain
MTNNIHIEKNFSTQTILLTRTFNAPLQTIWRAHTDSSVLDQWWGPQPWRAETKTMHFENGGSRLYAMIGPEGEKHWSIMHYNAIVPLKSFDIVDAFADEHGNINEALPVSKGEVTFAPAGNGTAVTFKMIFNNPGDLEKIVEMGFEEGITICMNQLENLIAQGKV